MNIFLLAENRFAAGSAAPAYRDHAFSFDAGNGRERSHPEPEGIPQAAPSQRTEAIASSKDTFIAVIFPLVCEYRVFNNIIGKRATGNRNRTTACYK
jgi:hypothetical protein